MQTNAHLRTYNQIPKLNCSWHSEYFSWPLWPRLSLLASLAKLPNEVFLLYLSRVVDTVGGPISTSTSIWKIAEKTCELLATMHWQRIYSWKLLLLSIYQVVCNQNVTKYFYLPYTYTGGNNPVWQLPSHCNCRLVISKGSGFGHLS